MHPRTRLVYFYFFRVNFLVIALTSGRCDQVWLPWQRCICRSRYGCFCLSPQVTYLHTKIEGGLKFFISNFASLSWRIALNGKKSALVPLSHQSLKGAVNCGVQLRAATCSKSSFVTFIREGQDNRNIKCNDDIIDLA